MEDENELIAAIRQLASELGCTPTREQFSKVVANSRIKVTTRFGGYNQLVNAAGLTPTRQRKVSNQIFETNIDKHLQNYQPVQYTAHKPYPTMAIISDIHWPFHCERVITLFQQYVSEHTPEYIILNGDAWDMYSHSKFPRSHNTFTPRDEQRMARESNEKFWKDIHQISPKSACYQMIGNHDVRPMKRILEAYPEAEDWIAEKLKELLTFTNVKTIFDAREELIIDDRIAVFHGYKSQLGAHRDYTLMCTINGHTHRGGVVFRQIRGQVLWELNSGFAGDPNAKGLTYTPQRIVEWTPGFAAVDRHGPRFIAA